MLRIPEGATFCPTLMEGPVLSHSLMLGSFLSPPSAQHEVWMLRHMLAYLGAYTSFFVSSLVDNTPYFSE